MKPTNSINKLRRYSDKRKKNNAMRQLGDMKQGGSMQAKSETNPEILKGTGLTHEIVHPPAKTMHYAKQGSFDLSTSYGKLSKL